MATEKSGKALKIDVKTPPVRPRAPLSCRPSCSTHPEHRTVAPKWSRLSFAAKTPGHALDQNPR